MIIASARAYYSTTYSAWELFRSWGRRIHELWLLSCKYRAHNMLSAQYWYIRCIHDYVGSSATHHPAVASGCRTRELATRFFTLGRLPVLPQRIRNQYRSGQKHCTTGCAVPCLSTLRPSHHWSTARNICAEPAIYGELRSLPAVPQVWTILRSGVVIRGRYEIYRNNRESIKLIFLHQGSIHYDGGA